jgi:hypothetical protein
MNVSTSDRLELPFLNNVPALEVNEGAPYNELEAWASGTCFASTRMRRNRGWVRYIEARAGWSP